MKKKITMLFAALLACVGVMAQAYDGVYTIGVDENIQRGYVAAGVGYTEYPVLSGITLNGYTQNDTESIENGKNWYITSVDEGTTYYIYNVALGKFLVGGDVINFGDTPYTWSFSDNSGYVNIKDVTVEEFLSGGCGRSAANRPIAYDTNINDGGAKHTITAVDGGETTFATQIAAADAAIQALVNSVVDMVYVYKYGETEWGRETIEAKKGEAYPAPEARYGVTYTLPEGNVAADAVDGTEVEVTCSLAAGFPFVFAETYNAETAEWYSLTLRAKKVAYVNDSFVYSNDVTTGSFFTFTGNPIAGYTIYNYDGGNKAVWADTPANGTVIGLVETANGTWELLGTNTADNYLFKVKGTSNSYMHDYNSKFSYWLDNRAATDAGSYVTITSPSAGLQALVEKAGLLTSSANNGVGTITTASATTLNAAVDAAEGANTLAEIVNATNSLQGAYQEALNDIVLPEEGKFYTIQNAYSNVYMGVGNAGGMVSENAAAIGEVFQFVAAEDDKFYLYNVERGSYLSSAPGHGGGQASATATETSNAKVVTIANLGKETQVSITPAGGTTLHHDANYGTIVGWTGDADSRSAWKIVEVDVATLAHAVAVTEAGWATLTLGYNATIPAGVTAYAVSEIDGQYAKLTEVTGVIPAGEAVLLNAEAGTYEFKYAESAEPVASNLLEGTVFNSNVTADAYVLAVKEDVVGLYKATKNQAENTAFLNNAFKAYLPAPAGAAPAMFSFGRGEGTTGIETAVSGEQTVVIYDLAGRRVEKMEKGIYIVNGKKVIR